MDLKSPNWLVPHTDSVDILLQELNREHVAPGTFVVRPSGKSTSDFVLMVRHGVPKLAVSENFVEQYKISGISSKFVGRTESDSMSYTMCGIQFSTLQDIVRHFCLNKLPSIKITLIDRKRAYSINNDGWSKFFFFTYLLFFLYLTTALCEICLSRRFSIHLPHPAFVNLQHTV